jgi:hypothetical protein
VSQRVKLFWWFAIVGVLSLFMRFYDSLDGRDPHQRIRVKYTTSQIQR